MSKNLKKIAKISKRKYVVEIRQHLHEVRNWPWKCAKRRKTEKNWVEISWNLATSSWGIKLTLKNEQKLAKISKSELKFGNIFMRYKLDSENCAKISKSEKKLVEVSWNLATSSWGIKLSLKNVQKCPKMNKNEQTLVEIWQHLHEVQNWLWKMCKNEQKWEKMSSNLATSSWGPVLTLQNK